MKIFFKIKISLKIPVSANFIHPDSPQTGGEWMKKIVSFHKLKITNSPGNPLGQVDSFFRLYLKIQYKIIFCLYFLNRFP